MNTHTATVEPAAMIDPAWTPERGYGHAGNLAAIAAATEARLAEAAAALEEPRCPCGGPLDRFGSCVYAADAAGRLVLAPNRAAQAAAFRVHREQSRATA